MKTLFSRILLAQVVAVVLALLVATVITRTSLNHGFTGFLQRQESAVLATLAPALVDVYEQQGSWDFLRDNPNNWQRIWRLSRGQQGGPGAGGPRRGPTQGPGRGGPPETDAAGPAAPPDSELRWLANPGRGALRDRLFLLDELKNPIAGSGPSGLEGLALQELAVDGTIIGWIGFAPTGNVLPPDAQRFLAGQVRIMFLALGLALVVAALLSWILARNVSRPVQSLARTVRQLSDGQYEARAADTPGDEIGTLAKHVNRLAESLQKSRTARKRWMADIAHELRTPVAVMKGEIEAIADGVRQVDGNTAASLNEEINHLASMVDDLQALALADAGALNIHRQELDLDELVRFSADSFRTRLAEKNLQLSLDLAEGLEINADAQRIRQLLHNLLENCCRYTDADGTIWLGLSRKGDKAVLKLEDSGPGVSDEQLEKLFDRFYRAEGSRSRATGGSGLGLSICRNIAEAHGGRIEAAHSPRGGLMLQIVLPV